jgi:putative PIN family toxin of toxin-antitoxin system
MKPEVLVKAVFDTNIFISAFLFPQGTPAKIYLLAIRKKFQLCSSPAIMAEVANKLRSKFQVEEEDIVDLLKQVARLAVIVKPKIEIDLVVDKPDNKVLECAVEAKADLIVSGDHHLLNLREFQGIRIIRATDFRHIFP